MSSNEKNADYQAEVITEEQRLQRFIGFDVVDCECKQIGTVEAVWQEASGDAAFISVRAGWLGLGEAHVVPAHRVQVNEGALKIKLPYREAVIKAAPRFDVGADAMGTHHEEVIAYYAAHDASLSEVYRAAVTPAGARMSETDVETLKLKEERMRVGKREVEAGGYRLRKVVRTEVVEQPVELKREELVIERVPVAEGDKVTQPIGEDEVYIPLRREEAIVGKDVRVREEVRAHKHVALDTERVAEEVAHEDVEVEKVDAEHVRVATTQEAQSQA
jgi:uncharacterized protein (TIGR02271 family)